MKKNQIIQQRLNKSYKFSVLDIILTFCAL